MKVYVVGNSIGYVNWIKDCQLIKDFKNADIVFFTGGEDVDPQFYGCKKHHRTFSNPNRDIREIEIFKQLNENQLVVGVCRGSQLCSVLNGGLLVQDVINHGLWGTHKITNGEKTFDITSTHHQMQYPFNLPKEDYDILYWADGRSKDHYLGDKIDSAPIEEFGEPEIVLYHKKGYPKCLAIQGHPEMIPDYPICEELNNLLKKYVSQVD